MTIENWDQMGSNVRSLVENQNSVSYLEENMSEIRRIADSAVDILADGFQWEDVISMFKIVGPLMSIAKEINELDNKGKEQFVVDAVWLIYKTVDSYPDGESNRINIPVLFGSLETKFEKKMIDFAARTAIKAVYGYAKEHGWA